MTDVIARRAARVLVVDATGRLLLFRGFDPAAPDQRFWFTVGGGLEPGETSAQGAVRELYEETGIVVAAETLSAPVWRDVTEFGFDRHRYRQEQDFFVVRVADDLVLAPAALSAVEHATIDQARWWSLPELEATEQTYHPATLPVLLRRCAEASVPVVRHPAPHAASDGGV